jgi:hypothetical protein
MQLVLMENGTTQLDGQLILQWELQQPIDLQLVYMMQLKLIYRVRN